MNKATCTLLAAAAALTLSGAAYAQNNTLATPSVTSPAAATSGYGTSSAATSDSGTGSNSATAGMSSSANGGSTSNAAPVSHNTLATPSVSSPAGQ
ncbi:hypothetical protein [Paraburkholderia sp. DHOC27]|uniref:hypothetical protein n=1 Tax=Paraburkholderia sp. DHOC27 TaxID=2303330 RepID=UPI000E3C68FE|nr:hypothetical protein [Paraburkholderia sp. DHOC27]RFU49590.1 hypothetical protein D0B32_07340 [Paraburkholderia sp. DHOC27]